MSENSENKNDNENEKNQNGVGDFFENAAENAERAGAVLGFVASTVGAYGRGFFKGFKQVVEERVPTDKVKEGTDNVKEFFGKGAEEIKKDFGTIADSMKDSVENEHAKHAEEYKAKQEKQTAEAVARLQKMRADKAAKEAAEKAAAETPATVVPTPDVVSVPEQSAADALSEELVDEETIHIIPIKEND